MRRIVYLLLVFFTLPVRAGVVEVSPIIPSLSRVSAVPSVLPASLISLSPSPLTLPSLPSASVLAVPVSVQAVAVNAVAVHPSAVRPSAVSAAHASKDDEDKILKSSEKAARKGAFSDFFDGSENSMRGTYKGDPAPVWSDSAAELTPALAKRLAAASSLRNSELIALMRELAASPVTPRGPPAFSDEHTFSFELEFQVHKQVSAADLKSLFKGKNALNHEEWEEWRKNGWLDESRWEKVWKRVVARVRARMPSGWRLISDSRGEGRNTLEINTGNEKGRYHRNTPQDWADLTAGLERVQSVLPGGLYSVHMHAGHEALKKVSPSDGREYLDVESSGFGRLVKIFEAHWRALAGYAYKPVVGTAVDMMPHKALDPRRAHYYTDDHSVMLNLHDRFPTIENRILSGLLRWRHKKGGYVLDEEKMAEHAWWSFALLRRAADGAPPLATLGVPVTAGEKPSPAHMARFADAIYGDDLVGKALALGRLGTTLGQDAGLEGLALRKERGAARSAYAELGLVELYDLHAEAGGYEPRWEKKLEEPARRARLLKDLGRASPTLTTMFEYFPEEIAVRLHEETRAARPKGPLAWLLRAWRAFLRLFSAGV